MILNETSCHALAKNADNQKKLTYQAYPQQGIALVQVLLIVAVISLMLLGMVNYTKQQQRQVMDVELSLTTDLELYSAANELQFALLTNGWTEFNESDNPLAQAWNFHGGAFTVGDIQVRIFNLASLISVTSDEEGVRNVLSYQGVDEATARRLAAQLRSRVRIETADDLLRLPSESATNGVPLQHIRELIGLGEWQEEYVQMLEPFANLYPNAGLSPVYTPDGMLELLVSRTKADMIRQMRDAGSLSRDDLLNILELRGDEFVQLTPGPRFRLELSLPVDEHVRQYLRQDIYIDPYAQIPLRLLSQRSHQ